VNHRPSRVSKLIQHQLGLIIARELEFDKTLVTITSVDTNKKLDHSVVNVSVIPSSEQGNVLKLLDKEAPIMRHLLLKRINIKPMPKLIFKLDKGIDNATRVESILVDQYQNSL